MSIKALIRVLSLGLLLSVFFVGCHQSQSSGGSIPANSKVFEVRGTVLSTDAERGEVTLKHDEISGYMPAMTMPFAIKDPAIIPELKRGDLVRAQLVITAKGTSWLQDVVWTEGQSTTTANSVPAQHTHNGDAVPAFRFTNQDGKPIELRQYSGKALLVTFIYTRCPLPTFCPLVTSRFVAINNELKKDPAVYRNTHLLSISFDPAYDTPPVLRRYGLAYVGSPSEFAHWDFAVPSQKELPQIAKYFGFQYFEENGQIAHTLNTVILGRDGRIVQDWAGSEWNKSEILDKLKKVSQRSQ